MKFPLSKNWSKNWSKSWSKNGALALSSKAGKKSSEILQIIILSLFMTSGFFTVLSLVLFLLIPGKVEATKAQAADLQELVKLLADKSDLRKTRDQVNELKKAGAEVNLRTIVDQNLEELSWTSKPEVVSRPLKGKTFEYNQTIKLKEASLQSLFNFIARIKQAQGSIRVGTLNFSRERRGNTKDAWTASLNFFHYRNEEVLKQLGSPGPAAKPPAPAPEGESKAPAADTTPEPKPAGAPEAAGPEEEEER